MRKKRLTRRRAIVLALAVVAVVEAGLALAVLARDDDTAAPTRALPLHPVAGTFEPDTKKVDDCLEQQCLEQAFGNLAYYVGPKAALARFDDLFGDGADPSCHRIAHAIGAASLARFQGNVARTFAAGSPSCWSGYYHGVLERSLVQAKTRSPAELGRIARKLCADGGVRAVPWLAYQCLHGLGHGLMISTGLDLPRSLAACRRLETDWDRTSCKGGAFMENIATSYGVESRWVRDDDPVYPCNVVAESDKRPCYQLATSRILRVVGVDWERTAEICASVEQGWVEECFQSLGRDISGQTHRDAEEIAETCEVARPYGGEDECIAYAAMDITANFTSGRPTMALCDALSASLRAVCYHSIGMVMGRFKSSPAAREADCGALTTVPADREQCIRGTRDYFTQIPTEAVGSGSRGG
jgi:hypothetical protein